MKKILTRNLIILITIIIMVFMIILFASGEFNPKYIKSKEKSLISFEGVIEVKDSFDLNEQVNSYLQGKNIERKFIHNNGEMIISDIYDKTEREGENVFGILIEKSGMCIYICNKKI